MHDPDTDQVFVPVELDEAIADVEMELDGESEATFQVSVGAVAALAIGVDNTVATPYLLRPFEHGADIVVHSMTKYMGGHGTTLAGAIVDSGKFPWADHKIRFHRLNTPDVSYHGVIYTEAFGPAAYIGRARVVPLRNMGAALSPFNAFQILQGIETLGLRMDRVNENTLTVAKFLEKRSKVAWVNYAGLPSSPWHDRAKKYFGGRGYGSVLAFNIKGGREAGEKFVAGLQLHSHVANIGDVRSLVIQPSTTTHSQLTAEEQVASGVNPGLVRLSVGLESIKDIIADLELGFAAAK